jgi:hypothetical protein
MSSSSNDVTCVCFKCTRSNERGITWSAVDHADHVKKLTGAGYRLCKCSVCLQYTPEMGVYRTIKTIKKHRDDDNARAADRHRQAIAVENNNIMDIERKYDEEGQQQFIPFEAHNYADLDIDEPAVDNTKNEIDDIFDTNVDIDDSNIDSEDEERQALIQEQEALVNYNNNNENNNIQVEDSDSSLVVVPKREKMSADILNLFRLASSNKFTQTAVDAILDWTHRTYPKESQDKNIPQKYKHLNNICKRSKAHYNMVNPNKINNNNNNIRLYLMI